MLSWGSGIIPHMCYIGMCRTQGRFGHKQGIDFVGHFGLKQGVVLHSSLESGMFSQKKLLFYHYRRDHKQKPFKNYVQGNRVIFGRVINRVTVLGSGPHIPTIFFWDNSPEVCFLTLVLLYIFSYENEFDFHDSEHVRL